LKPRPIPLLCFALLLALNPSCRPQTAAPRPTPIDAATATAEALPPYIGPAVSWIEVDLTRQLVVLHEGGSIIAKLPASSGVAGHSTPPGLYRVQMMEKGPDENVPGVFVSDILIFHMGKELGIHSMPMNAEGQVLDPTLGRPSTGGCVRVGDSARVFEFAELGMRIWVH